MSITSASAALAPSISCSRNGRRHWRRTTRSSRNKPSVVVAAANNDVNGDEVVFRANNDVNGGGDGGDADVITHPRVLSRRGALRAALGATAALGMTTTADASLAASSEANAGTVNPRAYFQRFPTLFAPFYGDDERATILKEVVPGSVWALEQNLARETRPSFNSFIHLSLRRFVRARVNAA